VVELMSRLRDLDGHYPGLVPDLHPEASLAQHALLAIVEHWAIALFATWRGLARVYLADHYQPDPRNSPRLHEERRLDLENRLAEVLALLEDGA
jgi:hypothetical protein